MDLRNASDGLLIKQYQAGKDEAFDILYQRYRRQLYSYLNRMFPGRRAVADDLHQQTWLKVLKALPDYREQERFISWAFRIAHNLAMDHFRREARHEEVEVDEKWPDEYAPPWAALDREALQEALDQAIQELAPEQREVVLLRKQGIPFKEIAKIQNVSINTVLGRMHYSVKKLRRSLRRLLD